MGLSFDLISEFVKITNDKKESPKEGMVYATVVSGKGGKYVKIDGSDLLTPADTTTDIEDGERVTLLIKDHKAVITGNVTNPSASTTKVDKVTESVNSVSDRVGTFELIVADKVDVKELEAYKATIEVLIAGKATIEDLTVTNAKIENLEVKHAEIEDLVADKATIEDLEAVNAVIEKLKVKDAEIENAVIDNLEATTAEIKILNADFAQIKTLVNGNLTSDNILAFKLTSEKVTVEDAFIKDAMIDNISAGKINAGKINTNSVSIGSEDGGMLITGSTQQFTDKNGNVRIQIGKDASGDFTFILYGEDGQGQLINQNGITASAISDGLIVNDMVSDHAAISGGKLDISSVITEINSDNSTTIKSSKIYLNEQAQSLEVAFNSLKTQVDTIQEETIQGDLTAIVEQVQSNTSKIEVNKNSINTLISEDTVIKKQVTDLQGTLTETETTLTSKYTALNQNLDGFKATVADTYATKKSVTDVVDNISTNYSTTSAMNSAIEQKAQEISASVSSTYATKNEVSTLDNTLKTDYSTTKEMESAITVAKEEINLGVSQLYETKENVTSKVESAKSYADTKKSEAISAAASDATTKANNAKSEAITSANETLTSTISNYYTKTQTDSQINVAKEEINLGVSSTYETKENVTSKVESAKSYADTKKSEAISAAASDATTKANNAKSEAITSANETLTSTISNYYTKTQTDSQINVAKEEINLSVSNTYETKTNVDSKINNIQIGGRNLFKGYGENEIALTNYQNTGSFTQFKDNLTFNPADYIGKQFTISFYAKSPNGTTKLQLYNSNENPRYFYFHTTLDTNLGNAWKYYTYTFTNEDRGSSFDINESNKIEIYAENKTGVLVKKIKVELGNKATDWTPTPEDIESDITSIESETKSIKQTVSSLVLGTDSINASVNSLRESMENTTNGLSSEISKIQDQVNLAMTSTDVRIEIQKELQNGVNKVSTSTGFTFDDKGLNVSKSDSEMKTQISEDGMKIYKNKEVMLTANNQGVDAKNLHATTYLIIGGNSRMEDFTENGSKHTAVFWIG